MSVQDGRARWTNDVVSEQQHRKQRERTFERTNPHDRFSRMGLVKVNQESDWIAQRLPNGHSRAAVFRALAKLVNKEQDITEAVFATEDAQAGSRVIFPIEDARTCRPTR